MIYPNKNNNNNNLQRAKENFLFLLGRRRNDFRVGKKKGKKRKKIRVEEGNNRARSTVQKYSGKQYTDLARYFQRDGISNGEFFERSVTVLSIVLSRRVWSVGGGASNRYNLFPFAMDFFSPPFFPSFFSKNRCKILPGKEEGRGGMTNTRSDEPARL